MPNNPRGGGVSRRVEGEDRNELRDTIDQLVVPEGMSVIARTAAIGRSLEELQWDLNYLMQLWQRGRRRLQGHGAEAVPDLPRVEPGDPRHPRLLPARHRRDPDRHRRNLRAGGGVHADRDAGQRRQGQALPRRRAALLALPDRAPDRERLRPARQPALGRRDRDRPHRGAGRRSTSTRRAPPRATTSRKPPTAPTWRRPRKSPASCGCATWAA